MDKLEKLSEKYRETIQKRGDEWCVLHGHPKKKGSKTDKPKGAVIACHPSKKKAVAQHRAIVISKSRQSYRPKLEKFMEEDIGDVLKRIKKWMLGESFKEFLTPVQIKDLIIVSKTLKDIADGNPPDAKETIKRIGLALIGH